MPVLAWGQKHAFEKGLPDNLRIDGTITCFWEDQQGFLWIGSTDGLYRYDGLALKTFRYNAKDSSSLSANYIYQITQDRNGQIWVATRRGISVYSQATEKFHRFFPQEDQAFGADNSVLCIHIDHKNQVWYGTYAGLTVMQNDGSKKQRYVPLGEKVDPSLIPATWDIFEDSQHNIWAGNNLGVVIYPQGELANVQHYPPPFSLDKEAHISDRVFSFAELANGDIWMGTNHGIFKIEGVLTDLSFQHFAPEKSQPNSLSGPLVQSLYAQGNTLWAGTWTNGLNRIYPDQAKEGQYLFEHYKADANTPAALGNNKIMAVHQDQSGVLWVATGSSLEKSAPLNKKFKSVSQLANTSDGLTSDIVKSILFDRQGNLWVGTNEGLNFLPAADFLKGEFKFQHYVHDPGNENSLSHNNIYGLYEDSRGVIWVAAYWALNYILPQDIGKPHPFHRIIGADGLPHTFTYNIVESQPNQYWVATYGQLAKMTFDPFQTDTKPSIASFDMDPSRPDALVNATTYIVEKDRFGHCWVGTYNGLSKIVEENGKVRFENYQNDIQDSTSLSNNSIADLHLDQDGQLWVATRVGLNRLMQQSEQGPVHFKAYGIAEGLLNDVIQCIEHDQDGLLWLGTNYGLHVFSPEEGKVIKTYTAADGLPANSQIYRSSTSNEQGVLFFGSPGGFSYFNPRQIIENQHPPKVEITDLKIRNQSVVPRQQKGAVLQQSINLTDAITLRYNQDMIEFQFAALDFNRPEKNTFAYRLVGFDPDWVHIGGRSNVTFTNLSPGHYRLLVKAANNDQYWSEQARVLQITVLPPPWKTWWAFTIYACLLLASLFAAIRWFVQRQTRELAAQHRQTQMRYEERDRLRKKHAADFHDELGHRFTKISLFLELANRRASNTGEVQNYLAKIRQHTSALSDGVRDLIWGLDPQKDNLYQTLLRLQEFGDNLFEYANIEFHTSGIQSSLSAINLSADDKRQILFIFKEAMNNCLKHAQAKKTALVFCITKGIATLKFKDDGLGFKHTPSLKQGYGLKNMQQRALKLDGELTIDSHPGEGTSITLEMQLPHKREE